MLPRNMMSNGENSEELGLPMSNDINALLSDFRYQRLIGRSLKSSRLFGSAVTFNPGKAVSITARCSRVMSANSVPPSATFVN